MESLSSLLFICDCRHIPDTALLSSMFLMNLFNGYVDINAFFFRGMEQFWHCLVLFKQPRSA